MLNDKELERLRSFLQSDCDPPSSVAGETDGAEAADGRSTGASGEKSESSKNSAADETARKRAVARDVIENIGAEYVQLRKHGRSKAMSTIQERLMEFAHVLIDAGMMSPKDWISIIVELDKAQANGSNGGDDLPTDQLAAWLSAKEETTQ